MLSWVSLNILFLWLFWISNYKLHEKGTLVLFLLLNIWYSYIQSRTEDKIERFKKAVEYYSVTTKLSSLPVGPSFLGKASIWPRAALYVEETESLRTPGTECNHLFVLHPPRSYSYLIDICLLISIIREVTWNRALISWIYRWDPMPFP